MAYARVSTGTSSPQSVKHWIIRSIQRPGSPQNRSRSCVGKSEFGRPIQRPANNLTPAAGGSGGGWAVGLGPRCDRSRVSASASAIRQWTPRSVARSRLPTHPQHNLPETILEEPRSPLFTLAFAASISRETLLSDSPPKRNCSRCGRRTAVAVNIVNVGGLWRLGRLGDVEDPARQRPMQLVVTVRGTNLALITAARVA
jgi:hypothetical protein